VAYLLFFFFVTFFFFLFTVFFFFLAPHIPQLMVPSLPAEDHSGELCLHNTKKTYK